MMNQEAINGGDGYHHLDMQQSDFHPFETNRTDIERLKMAGLQKTQDEEELRELNEKFSAFLTKVKQLEIDNQMLEQRLETLRAEWDDNVTEMSREKNNELRIANETARKNYNTTCAVNGQAKGCMLEAQFIRDQIEFNQQLNDKASDDIQSLSEQNRNIIEQMSMLESKIQQKRSELDEAMAEYSKYGQELRKLQSSFAQHYTERITLQMEIPLLSDVILCIRNISDLKIEHYQNVYDNLLEPTQFYRSELGKAIRGIRRDFTALDNLQRGEVEHYYESRLAEARRELELNHRKVQEAKVRERSDITELATLLEHVKQLNNVKSDLEKEQSRLTTYAYNLESEIREKSSGRRKEEEECDREISHLQQQIGCVKEELDILREDNVTLKFEINTYRTLLEGEEGRLEPVCRGGGSDGGYHQHLKEKSDTYFDDKLRLRTKESVRGSNSGSQEDSISLYFDESSAAAAVGGAPDSRGAAANSNCIVIENTGNCDVNLTNWYIAQRADNKEGFKQIMKFDQNLLIPRNGRAKIYPENTASPTPQEQHNVIVLKAQHGWSRDDTEPVSLHKPDGQMVYQLC